MAPRSTQRPGGLEVRMLTAMSLLGLLYTAIGWGLHLVGVPAVAIITLMGVVVAIQWLVTGRLALGATSAKQVSAEQAPVLHQTLERLCALTGQPKPRLALSPDQAPNAFTVGRSRRHATIVVTQGLLQRLCPRELEAVLAHELAHIEHRDLAVMAIASSLAVALAWLARRTAELACRLDLFDLFDVLEVGPAVILGWLAGVVAMAVVSAIAYLPLRALSRYRELAADRAAALHLGRPDLLAATLVKVDGAGAIPTGDLRAQSVPAIGFVARPGRFGGWFSTHPSLACRLRLLDALRNGTAAPSR